MPSFAFQSREVPGKMLSGTPEASSGDNAPTTDHHETDETLQVIGQIAKANLHRGAGNAYPMQKQMTRPLPLRRENMLHADTNP